MIKNIEKAIDQCNRYQKFDWYNNFSIISSYFSDLLICAKNPYSSQDLLIDLKLEILKNKDLFLENDLSIKAYNCLTRNINLLIDWLIYNTL